WGQCGGIGWTGPTACASGTTCKVSNPYVRLISMLFISTSLTFFGFIVQPVFVNHQVRSGSWRILAGMSSALGGELEAVVCLLYVYLHYVFMQSLYPVISRYPSSVQIVPESLINISLRVCR
ncbi:hypothetical protein SISNIDRAFT_412937, partial [Sistotremastrum niveocremeum HHB9708]